MFVSLAILLLAFGCSGVWLPVGLLWVVVTWVGTYVVLSWVLVMLVVVGFGYVRLRGLILRFRCLIGVFTFVW